MTRGIEEYDVSPARHIDLVCTDVLGDSAELSAGNVGRPDGIEELGLTMVNVTHDRDDRSPGLEILLTLRIILDDCFIVEGYEMDGTSVFGCDDLGSVVIDLLVDRYHHSHLEELADNVARLDVHLLGKLTDSDVLHNVDALGNCGKLALFLLLLQVLEVDLLIPSVPVVDVFLLLSAGLPGT